MQIKGIHHINIGCRSSDLPAVGTRQRSPGADSKPWAARPSSTVRNSGMSSCAMAVLPKPLAYKWIDLQKTIRGGCAGAAGAGTGRVSAGGRSRRNL